ncbi:MAG TPA: hypothetical protein VHM20_04975 [Gammaproteobacteria bacterium]|jgi:hypothetical protein|nr:hypothetical protein [Gammaproteobacteria bacterium]
MESRALKEDDWIQIVDPETEASLLQQEILRIQSDKLLLKKDVAKHLLDTITTLQSVDFAKLNYEKLEIDLKNANDALEKETQARAEEKANLQAQNAKLTKQISQLKKCNKQIKVQRKQAKKFIKVLANYLTNLDKELAKVMNNLEELEQIKKQLHKSNLETLRFEKIILQRDAEIMQLKNEKADQSRMEKSPRTDMGFFTPMKTQDHTTVVRKNTFQP